MTQSLQASSQAGSGQMPSQTLIPQLSLQSMFWRPKFAKDSVWSVHLPVAFWITEALRPQRVVELGTHEGTSWFAFCQAIERLNPYGECIGFSAAPLDAGLVEYTEAQYQEFARVKQTTQTDALEQLEEGSVDLMHVAPGVAKPISKEWAQWEARLSSRGVVLISQAGPGQPGEALYRQLRENRAHFLFEQSQGLAIVAVGSRQSEALERLLSFQPGQPGIRLVQQVFQRLGLACCVSTPSGTPSPQAGGWESAEAADMGKRQVESARRDAEVAREEAEALRSSADSAKYESERRIATLEQEKAHLEAALQARDQEQEKLRANQRRLEQEQATRFDETAKLTGLLQAAEQTQIKSQARIQELETDKRKAQEEGERHAKALEALQQRHQSLEQRHEQQARVLEHQTQQLQTLEAARQEAEQQQVQQQRRLDTAERAQAALKEENATLQRQQQARFEELAELTRMLEEKEQRLAELTEQPKRLAETFASLGRRAKGRGDRRASKEDLRLVKESGFFDEAWYTKRYPDVGQSGKNALEHFVNFGGQEGRSPGPAFDSQWYLIEYPDVAQAKLNPLVHYLRFGSKEDRLPTPEAWKGEKHGS